MGLLDISRTKSILSDVSRHLRYFNKVRRGILDSSDSKQQKEDTLRVGRDVCTTRIDSIIHHHCGNHDNCDKSHCQFKNIEFETELANTITGTVLSEMEQSVIVNTRYAVVNLEDQRWT